ncbi:MAG: CopG family transcriptional regulator [Planctomycetes bacterium]|nr:CopG family transcriptional regulator [Planctomycetota bacterium]
MPVGIAYERAAPTSANRYMRVTAEPAGDVPDLNGPLRKSPGANILSNILMATSVHIPKPLLEAVDRRARALRVSRNQIIVKALEHEMNRELDWSPGFFERFSAIDDSSSSAVDEMMKAIKNARLSKKPPQL